MTNEKYIEIGNSLLSIDNIKNIVKLALDIERNIVSYSNCLIVEYPFHTVYVPYYIDEDVTNIKYIHVFYLIAAYYNFDNVEKYLEFIKDIEAPSDLDFYNRVRNCSQYNESIINNPEIQLWIRMQ